MNTKQKKALYESIMKSVAKTIKKQLNESDNYNTTMYKRINDFFDNGIHTGSADRDTKLRNYIKYTIIQLTKGILKIDKKPSEFDSVEDYIDNVWPLIGVKTQAKYLETLTKEKIKENPLFEFINKGYIDEFNGYESESHVVTSELPKNFPLVDTWTNEDDFKTFANTRTAKEIATYCLQNLGFGFSKSEKAAEILYLLCKKIFDEQGIDLKQQYEDNWKRKKINI